MLAGAELCDPHLDGVATQSFAGGFGLRQRLRLIRRVGWPETIFRSFVRRPGSAQVCFRGVGVGFTKKKVARGQVGMDFDRGGAARRRGR